ncbi:MAG TPA: hypothetical protein VLB44_17330 [Kofleriaceae bacterium]|nr:hypothetical protein [Kofleriaceae bacterium]
MTPFWFAALAIGCAGCAEIYDLDQPQSDGSGRPYVLPPHVSVKPVFFVPHDQPIPSADQQSRLVRHLAWARQRYGEMLGNGETFALASADAEVIRGAHDVAEYLASPDLGASEIMSELLAHVHHTRFDNPYVFTTILMNTTSAEPSGYGRPCNGGLDGGGGLLVLSSTTLDAFNFQSTLQHELGHAFGLPHVDVYGYDMSTNASIMSYNEGQWTNGFTPSAMPGILIPEDRHALAMNDRVFSDLAFDPARDVPSGYTLAPVVPFGAMDVAGQPPNLVMTTTPSGEMYGSSVSHVVQGILEPSRGPGVTFDASAMWHSDVTSTGEVSIELAFPLEVALTEIRVHSQHSGLYHAAVAVRVEAQPPDSDFVEVTRRDVAVDDSVKFPVTSARLWRLSFRATESDMVVIRGLQFFIDNDEVFPPFVPLP